ncbi:MAG: hypothetical protein ACI865_002344 [Flavobacteriaceae bacterium]|jgi:hypothetical protein
MNKIRPNADRAKYAIAAMYSMIVLELAAFGYQYYVSTITLFDTVEDYDAFFQLSVIFIIVVSVLSILAAIVFIMWFRRAYYNLHQIVPTGLRYTEGWASGAWFIPVFNLWGPYQIAADLFKRTEGLLVNENLIEAKPVRFQIMGWWWGIWIASSVFSRIDARMEDIILPIAALSAILGIAAALLAVKMIQSYHEMEVLLPKLSDSRVTDVNSDDLLDSGM